MATSCLLDSVQLVTSICFLFLSFSQSAVRFLHDYNSRYTVFNNEHTLSKWLLILNLHLLLPPATRDLSPICPFHPCKTTGRLFSSPAVKMETPCFASGPATGLEPLWATKARYGVANSLQIPLEQRQVAQISPRTCTLLPSYTRIFKLLFLNNSPCPDQ